MWNSQEIFRIVPRFFLFALKSVTAVLWFLLPAGQCIFHSLTITITSFHSSIPHQSAPASAPQTGPSPSYFWETLVKETTMHTLPLPSLPLTSFVDPSCAIRFCISAGDFVNRPRSVALGLLVYLIHFSAWDNSKDCISSES